MSAVPPFNAQDTTLFFEDVTIGASVETRPIIADGERMVAFAREWDPMPIHVDPDAARASIFGGITASSVFTWGLKQLLIKQVLSEESVICMLGFTDGRLPKPLYANRAVRLVATWLDKRASGSRTDCGIVRFAIVLLTDHDEVVLEYTETVLMRRRLST